MRVTRVACRVVGKILSYLCLYMACVASAQLEDAAASIQTQGAVKSAQLLPPSRNEMSDGVSRPW